MRLHIASNHILEVYGEDLGTRLGERDIFPRLFINPPFTRDRQAFLSFSMYVYSVYTEPTLVVR